MSWFIPNPRSVDVRALVRAATVLLGGAFLVNFVLGYPSSGDYAIHAPVAGDNAGPMLTALAHANLAVAVSHQPLMGLTSLVLRLPSLVVALLLGLNAQQTYALGALMCLTPALALGGWMVARSPAHPRRLWPAVVAAVLVIAGPATLSAVEIGHPEEVLAAVLATGAVLAAGRDHPNWSWVLLGLAAGTKQWALLAFPCVMLALPGRRVGVAVKAGAIALALTATMPLIDPAAFARADSVVGGITSADPFSLWWPFSPAAHATSAGTAHLIPLGLTRSTAAALGLIGVLAALWLYGLRRRPRGMDAVALLALLELARCITDPDPLQYNFVALVIPLAAWEAVELRRPPLVTATATACVAFLASGSLVRFDGTGLSASPALLSGLSIAWTVVLGCYLAYHAFEPRGGMSLSKLGFAMPPSTSEMT